MTPDDAFACFRRLMLCELPADMRLGLYLAFYRTFGVAAIGGLLLATGESTNRPRRRADDTGLLMYTMFYYGFEHPDGIAAVRRLRGLHRRFTISNDDYLYVLACLAVVPSRWTDRHGRRRLTDDERTATAAFYLKLGQQLGIAGVPQTYAAFEEWFDAADRRRLRPHPAGPPLMQATRGLLVARLPRWLRPAAGRCVDALLDQRLRHALDVPEPGWAVRATVSLLLRVRRQVARLRPPADQPSFTPGQAVHSYPHGYRVDQLGPPDTGDRRATLTADS